MPERNVADGTEMLQEFEKCSSIVAQFAPLLQPSSVRCRHLHNVFRSWIYLCVSECGCESWGALFHEENKARKGAIYREKAMAPTPALLPRESQGRGSLAGCRPWGRTESDTTEAT